MIRIAVLFVAMAAASPSVAEAMAERPNLRGVKRKAAADSLPSERDLQLVSVKTVVLMCAHFLFQHLTTHRSQGGSIT